MGINRGPSSKGNPTDIIGGGGKAIGDPGLRGVAPKTTCKALLPVGGKAVVENDVKGGRRNK